MSLNVNEQNEIEALVKARDWEAVAAWFFYVKDVDERARKVIAWGRFFFPEFFPDISPEFHHDLVKKNFSDENEYTAAPRGFSKTTINQLCIMYKIQYKMKNFIVVIEKTFNESAEVIQTIREQFGTNEMLRLVYGPTESLFEKYDKDAYGDVVINGVRLRGKGFDTTIRGLKHKHIRPDEIYVDDIEQDAHINNMDQRTKYFKNFTRGIIPALDVNGNIKMVGTILHKDSLLQNMIDLHNGTVYAAWMDDDDPEGSLLWPDRWPYAKLMQKKREMGSAAFYQEYMNMPLDDESRIFKWEDLQKTFTELPRWYQVYVMLDVAQSKKESADFTGCVVIAVDDKHNWYVIHAKRYKVSGKELIDLIFKLNREYNPIAIGIERNAFEDQVKPFLDLRSEDTGKWPVVMELKHGGMNKTDRVRGALQGRVEAGRILFQENPEDDTDKLKQEMYDFPVAKNDDLVDGLGYGEQMSVRTREGEEVIPPHTLEQPTHMEQLLKNMRNDAKDAEDGVAYTGYDDL